MKYELHTYIYCAALQGRKQAEVHSLFFIRTSKIKLRLQVFLGFWHLSIFLIDLALGQSARPRFEPKPITKFTLRHPPPPPPHKLHSFFFIRTLCFCWGSSFLNFSTFEPVFFLFFFLAWAVLRLNFLIFFLNFWCSDSVFSTFLKYFSEICNQGLKINLKL